jgi:hypothetical protein
VLGLGRPCAYRLEKYNGQLAFAILHGAYRLPSLKYAVISAVIVF